MSRHVVVIGAGVIGLATALEMARDGLAVTVVERGELGRGCSEGNAGWVTPCISLPIASPGLRTKGLWWFFKHDSPLYINALELPGLAPWLLQFWRCCGVKHFERGARLMLEFARDGAERYEDWAAELDGIEWQRRGLLMAFRNEAAMSEEHSRLQSTGHGPLRRLDRGELAELEPALAQQGVRGGLHVGGEGWVEPLGLSRALARRCRQLGVEIREGLAVTKLSRSTGVARVDGVLSGGERIAADDIVIASGAEATQLAASCGTRIPLQAGKGYSLTIKNPRVSISHAIYLTSANIGVTPFAGSLRLAGTLEMSGINSRLDRKRLAGFERAAEREIPGITQGDSRREWVGMRPMTPDGMPVLGKLPHTPNVWIATGHQMLGITLAPRTGRLMCDLITGRAGGDELSTAFSPARFA